MLVEFKVDRLGLKAEFAMTKASKTWEHKGHIVDISVPIQLLKYALIVGDNSEFVDELENFLIGANNLDNNGLWEFSFLDSGKIYEYKIKKRKGEIILEELWAHGTGLKTKTQLIFSYANWKLDLNKKLFSVLKNIPEESANKLFEKILPYQKSAFDFLATSLLGLRFPHVNFVRLAGHPINNAKAASKELSSSHSNVVFFTSDPLLLDKDFFRNDEVWFFDKKNSNNIYSLAEFKDVRKDLVWSKAYLLGRFGSLPE